MDAAVSESPKAPRRVAIMLGIASGMRAFSAPAALAAWSWSGAGPAGRTCRAMVVAAAAGEVVADKLPNVPARVTPGALSVRVATAALCGARVAGYRGAVQAGLAAALSAAASYRVRIAAGATAPGGDPVIGAVEDVLVYGLAVRAAISTSS